MLIGEVPNLMSDIIAKVCVENTAFSFDDVFDYTVPDLFLSQTVPGVRVLVPFGKGNAARQGFVLALRRDDEKKQLKKITAVLDSAPLLTNEMIKLVLYLKEQTFCTLFDAARAMLPSGMGLRLVNSYIANPAVTQPMICELSEDEKAVYDYLSDKSAYVNEDKILKSLGYVSDYPVVKNLAKKGFLLCNTDSVQKTGDSTVKMARLSQFFLELDEMPKFTPKQKSVIKLLEQTGSASVKEICYFSGVTSAVVATLEKKGIIEIFENKVFRRPQFQKSSSIHNNLLLTKEQNIAYENMKKQYLSPKPENALLYGVTGSGKTQVYMRLIDDVIDDGKSAIVMVPEISLTPQMLNIFYERYGDMVAVFHSALSMGERKDEWQRVKNGSAKIALGTRSAVFAPFENLGLIVIDEEQEHTYKSEMTPRYNAKDVAAFRTKLNNSLLILASATPSISTYSDAKSGKISLNELPVRYGDAVLPEVITTNMKYGADLSKTSNLSTELEEAIQNNLDNKKQSILLLNRRGFNTFAACSKCGKVKVCPHCSISMTYHMRNGRLMCHYCGYSEPFTDLCTECGEKSVVYSGTGTQRLEDELKEKFPQAKVLRLDADSASSRYFFENSLKKFADGEYDILLGTQMVAKGLDFPNVTLVGVISIDQQLFNDDYKSSERAFDLLTQVVGRSGRGSDKGIAIIQTAFPENETIRFAKNQDYTGFYNLEIQIRKALIYPPYCDFCTIGFIGPDELNTKVAAKVFFEMVKSLHRTEYSDLSVILLSPLAPRVSKVAGKYRYRVIIKCKNNHKFREMIARLLKEFSNDKRFKSVTAYADINPENMF